MAGSKATLYVRWPDIWQTDCQQQVFWCYRYEEHSEYGSNSLVELAARYSGATCVLVVSAVQVRMHYMAMPETNKGQRQQARRFMLADLFDDDETNLSIHWADYPAGQAAFVLDKGAWETMLNTFVAAGLPVEKAFIDAQLLPNTKQWEALKWQQGAVFKFGNEHLLAVQEAWLQTPQIADKMLPPEQDSAVGHWLGGDVEVLDSPWGDWPNDAPDASDGLLFNKLITLHDPQSTIDLLHDDSRQSRARERIWGLIIVLVLGLAAAVWLFQLQSLSQQIQQTKEQQKSLLLHYFPQQQWRQSPLLTLNDWLEVTPTKASWPSLLQDLHEYQVSVASQHMRMTGQSLQLISMAWQPGELRLHLSLAAGVDGDTLISTKQKNDHQITWQPMDGQQGYMTIKNNAHLELGQ